MNAILETHQIDPATLHADAFEAFYARRKQALLALIAGAIGKELVASPATALAEPDMPDEWADEEDGETDAVAGSLENVDF